MNGIDLSLNFVGILPLTKVQKIIDCPVQLTFHQLILKFFAGNEHFGLERGRVTFD
jgi:hypothetical protein